MRIFVLPLQRSSEDLTLMKRILELTETEYDLIETVINYKRSYPNGEPQLRWALRIMLEEFLEEPLER